MNNPSPRPLGLDTMIRLLNEGTLVVVDTRTAISLPGSMPIPFESMTAEVLRPLLGKRVCFVGQTPSWGQSAALKLNALGIDVQEVFFLDAQLPAEKKRRGLVVVPLIATGILLLTALIGSLTRDSVCCRLTRGAIGSMECHWNNGSSVDVENAALAGQWRELQQIKEGRLRCAEDTSAAFDKLFADAENIVVKKPVSVTQKTLLPPSGDKHDFLSLSRYYWPNPDTENGLPYQRKDGVTNPDIYGDGYDKRAIEEMIDRVRTLSLAYFFFEKDLFAKKAAEQLRTWFVDEATRMNPNLNYAGLIPGQKPGRGLVPLNELPEILDASLLLSSSPHWTEEDAAAMRRWAEEYYAWMTRDTSGLTDKYLRNNRGTWYDVQAASLELFLGYSDKARDRLQAAKDRRLPQQFASDGSQPFEAERTKPWLYGTYNLKAWMDLADMGERVGVDLWNAATPDGASLRAGVAYLVTFSAGDASWPYADEINDQYLYPLLRRAVQAWNNPVHAAHLSKLEKRFDLLQSLATLRWPAE